MNTKEVRKRMIDCDVTNGELADACGVSHSVMSCIVHGKKPLSLQMAEKIQQALNIPDEQFTFYFLAESRKMK